MAVSLPLIKLYIRRRMNKASQLENLFMYKCPPPKFSLTPVE